MLEVVTAPDGKRLVGQGDQREAQELVPALDVELAGCDCELRRVGEGNEMRCGCRSWFLVDC